MIARFDAINLYDWFEGWRKHCLATQYIDKKKELENSGFGEFMKFRKRVSCGQAKLSDFGEIDLGLGLPGNI